MPYTEGGTGYRETDTSAIAAQAVEPKAGTVRAQVLAQFHRNVFPMTADEIAGQLGIEFITVRPRVTELGNRGLLKDSGVRRIGRFGRPQIAWEIA